jgi:hypothetical protein
LQGGCAGCSNGEKHTSALRREDDAEHNALVAAYLSWGADVSTTIERGHVVNCLAAMWSAMKAASLPTPARSAELRA